MTNRLSYRILHRFNSWSRIKITVEMFQAIFTLDRVTPCFLKIVMGLGRKICPKDEDFMTCYSRVATSSSGERVEDNLSNEDTQEENLAGGQYLISVCK